MATQAIAVPTVDATIDQRDKTRPAHWGGVYAMSLCVFALIASEFMPVSLLTPMAGDLHVTEGLAGQGIAISGAFAVLTSLSASAIARRVNRKTLLLALTALMCLSGAVVGLGPNYSTYMVGRALIGIVVGGFWALSAATAMQLVRAREVPRALALFNGGNALATVIAAPMGSFLASVIGWRGAFLCLVPIAVLAFAWLWLSLPSMPPRPRAAGSGNVFRLFRSRQVTLGMLAVGVFFMGQFALFTYLRPFLETVTRVDVPTLSLMLLAVGVAGVVGTSLIGRFVEKSLYRALTVIPIVMAGLALALIAFGASVPVVAMLLGLWGLVATAAPVGWWTWIARVLPDDAEAGGGLMVAVVQLSIALGSTVGGVLFDSTGLRGTFVASAALLLVAAALVLALLCDAGTSAQNDDARSDTASHHEATLVTPVTAMKIRISLNGAVIATATLDDTDSARQFAALLPLSLALKDYAATEKIADLPSALSTNGSPEGYTPSSGDISYYAPWGNLAIFHKDFRYSSGLVRLGRLDSGLEAMRRPGPITVRVEVAAP